MMRYLSKCTVTMLLSLVAVTLSAQEKVEVTMGADFVSQYIWRGQDLGHVSVQPTLGVGYKGLSLTAWGSVGVSHSDDVREIDLTLDYTTGGLSVGITDYWTDDPEDRYFLYDSHRTSHVFEAYAGYDFGVASLTWYTNFAGNDGENNSGHRAYSSYVEALVPFVLAGLDWEAALGIVPFATSYYDTSGFAVTQVSVKATKDLKITDSFSLPVFASVHANPRSQKAYLVFGFTLEI